MKLSSSTLRKAAEIQERIERLQEELSRLLQAGAEVTLTVAVLPRNSYRGESEGVKKKAASMVPSGRIRGRDPLRPRVLWHRLLSNVLESKDSPMSVSEILEGLLSNGYKFASPEPKKNLFARIYRLKGVKQVGPGKFTAE